MFSNKLHPDALDHPLFSPEQCRGLFEAVLVDDVIDAHVALPAAIHLDYTTDELTQCFRICRQVWKEGIDRGELRAIVAQVRSQDPLDPAVQLTFKKMRAKFKHLRFAFATYDARHHYPVALDWLTSVLGHLQDSFKNRHHAGMRRWGLALDVLLSRPFFALTVREIDGFRPSTPQAFRDYVHGQIAEIGSHLGQPMVTGQTFHALRKIISRQVAFYDSARTLYPSPYHHGLARYLSAINGMMGSLHDDLVLVKFAELSAYQEEEFVWPPEIHHRLTDLVACYQHGV